jgi:hypothetical protein
MVVAVALMKVKEWVSNGVSHHEIRVADVAALGGEPEQRSNSRLCDAAFVHRAVRGRKLLDGQEGLGRIRMDDEVRLRACEPGYGRREHAKRHHSKS